MKECNGIGWPQYLPRETQLAQRGERGLLAKVAIAGDKDGPLRVGCMRRLREVCVEAQRIVLGVHPRPVQLLTEGPQFLPLCLLYCIERRRWPLKVPLRGGTCIKINMEQRQ